MDDRTKFLEKYTAEFRIMCSPSESHPWLTDESYLQITVEVHKWTHYPYTLLMVQVRIWCAYLDQDPDQLWIGLINLRQSRRARFKMVWFSQRVWNNCGPCLKWKLSKIQWTGTNKDQPMSLNLSRSIDASRFWVIKQSYVECPLCIQNWHRTICWSRTSRILNNEI